MNNLKLNDKYIIKSLRTDEKDILFSKLDKKIFGNIKEEDTLTTNLYSVKTPEGKIIAFFGLEEFEENTLCLCYLFVKPNFRNQHIASNIVEKVKEVYKDKLYIYGHVHKDNKEALKFYSKKYVFLAVDRSSYTRHLDYAYVNGENSYEVLFKC